MNRCRSVACAMLAATLVGGCGSGPVGGARLDPPSADSVPASVSSADRVAYERGRRAEIRSLKDSVRAGSLKNSGELDSVGSVAARLPVDSYRAVAGRVEASLLRIDPSTRTPRERLLDSLRVERFILLIKLGEH